MNVDVSVLGCGWAGILISDFLSANHSVVCIEKNPYLGGLLRTVFIDEFAVDIHGSHVIFSRDKEVLKTILNYLENNVIEHKRKSYVYLSNIFVPYPIENGIYVLPLEERVEAIITFIEALFSLDKDWRPKNLEEWIYGFFGKWFAARYLVPYNKKIWKRPLSEIDVDWVYTPGRLPVPDWRDVLKSAIGIPTTGYVEQARFFYPLKGGIYSQYRSVYDRAVGKGVSIILNENVRGVSISNHGFYVVNNYVKSRYLYSTIPIPELVNSLLDKIRDDLLDYMRFFDYNGLVTVAIALNKPAPDQHWIYVPDENIVFHRYAWISNYSPHNSPPGKSLILVEITTQPGVKPDLDSMKEKTIRDLSRLGVIDENQVLFTHAWFTQYAYPIHRVGLLDARKYVLKTLEEHGIISLGRWGTWRYMNTDGVLSQVMNKIKSK